MFRVRGVRLWMSYADAGDDASVGPLREIVSLCGLTLGGDQAFDDGAEIGGDAHDGSKGRCRPRVVAIAGQLVGGMDQAEQLLDHAEDLDIERGARR